MAITAYSSVSLSYYPTKSCRKAFNVHNYPPPFLPCSKSTTAIELVPAAALATLIAAEECAALINSSASLLSSEMEKVLFIRENDSDDEMDSSNEPLLRRSRRRKRRQQREVENMNTEGSVISNLFCSKPQKDGQYLTRNAEAEYSFCLKEEARLEALKRKAEDKNGRVITLSQWAKAAGMSRINLDKILCNGREAQERIIRCYRRLVICIATSYQGKGLSIHDLIQEGNLGLLRGAKKFNPQKGYKLSTYVYWWIRQAMTRAIAKKSKITRIPVRNKCTKSHNKSLL